MHNIKISNNTNISLYKTLKKRAEKSVRGTKEGRKTTILKYEKKIKETEKKMELKLKRKEILSTEELFGKR